MPFLKNGKPSDWPTTRNNQNAPGQYWYQNISFNPYKQANTSPNSVGLLGYCCEEGVRRNWRRLGTAKGPQAIRQNLAKLPFHHTGMAIYDYGNISCLNAKMEIAQTVLSETVAKIIKNKHFPIVLGGGHDVSFGHFKGLQKHYAQSNLGIINMDAHFDLRPIENKPHSGTPFGQIATLLKQEGKPFHYMVLGIQKQSNTAQLFQIAKSLNVEYRVIGACVRENLLEVQKDLTQFIEKVEKVYLSIDLDVFSSHFAPGVSAPSPFGLEPDLVLDYIRTIFASKKVVACDVVEMNPTYDRDNTTANLAARIVDFLVGQDILNPPY